MAQKEESQPEWMPLGEFIRWRRGEVGITLRALAKSVGVSAPFMSDVEHGRRRPSEERLRAMAPILQCKERDLLDLSLTREAGRDLESDADLLRLVRRALRDSRYRRLVLGVPQ